MKIAVFKQNGRRRIGIAPGDSSDGFIDTVAALELLKLGSSELTHDMVSLLWSSSEPYGEYTQLKQAIVRNDDALADARLNIKQLKLEAPVSRPGKIICLAGNYRAH